jgi:hypothetical protein
LGTDLYLTVRKVKQIMETEKEIDGNMQFLSAAWWEGGRRR